MTEIKAAFATFNRGMQTFLDDLTAKFGATYIGIGTLAKQLRAFTAMDPSRRLPAQMAWPMYYKHKDLIAKRDDRIFTDYDIGNLKARAGIDPRSFWLAADARTREAIWRATEDHFDALQDINDLLPFEQVADADLSNDEAAAMAEIGISTGSDEKKAAITNAASNNDNINNSNTEETKAVVRQMAKSLQGLIGDDKALSDNVQSLLDKAVDGPKEAQPADTEAMITIVNGLMKKMTGGNDDNENDDDEQTDENGRPLSDKEIEARKASRTIEAIQDKIRMRYVVGQMLGVESMTKTTDPAILEAVRKEEEEDKIRGSRPESDRKSGICASANYKILALLERLKQVYGDLKRKDGRLMFPQLTIAFDGLLDRFKAAANDPFVVAEVGAWSVENEAAIRQRDDNLFLVPKHPFLIEFKSAQLWKAMSASSRDNFWTLAARPIQLASIHYRLESGGLSAVGGIINGLLDSAGMAYDSDGSGINPKALLADSLFRAATPGKLATMQGLFQKMTSPEDKGRTITSIMSLLNSVTGNNSKSTNDDDDDDDDGDAKTAVSTTVPSVDAGSLQADDTDGQLARRMDAILSGSPSSSAVDPRDAVVPASVPKQ